MKPDVRVQLNKNGMKPSKWWLLLILIALALGGITPATQAATTVQYIKLGDIVVGDITAGVDTVGARFNAVQDTLASIKVRPLQGSTLDPTIVLKDGSGTELDLGSSLKVNNKIAQVQNFKIPASGTYTFEIGGSSGAGSFQANTAGKVSNKVAITTISGTVTNDLTGDGLLNVAVSIGPFNLKTDLDGNYSEELPPGPYAVAFEVNNFESHAEAITLFDGLPATLDVALTPIAPVLVSASISGDTSPDGILTAMAAVEILDGSTFESILWTQNNSVTVTIDNANSDTATVTLPAENAYKEELIHVLSEPPIAEEDLPPNIPLPEGEFPGGLQDRFQVVGVNPHALEEAALVHLMVTVTTSSGSYADEVEIDAHLPWKVTTGIGNLPLGIPVLLHGKEQASYDWALTTPSGSSASLADAASQNPEFTPDVRGLYSLTVTDIGAGAPVTLLVDGGEWEGAITAQDADGRPLAQNCTVCHDGGFAADMFTPWAQTGHAEILTNNLNTSTHYGPNCFGCHTVGFDPSADNGGMDDASDYGDFLASGLLNNPGDNWTTMLADYPDAAQLSNIQCENCHGPQNSDAHVGSLLGEDQRISLSSDVCASCHGEPLRHARFQQWQLSGHANYELAIDESQSGNCSRCHTANGFLAWVEAGNTSASVTVSWTEDEAHAQTCVTCHDPHNVGTTTGLTTNAPVRIEENTPLLLAGFTALGVGKGATCMTCHNSRRGLRNDDTYGSDIARSPHGPTQTDVLMGQNAYFIPHGVRGVHSFVEETCVTCHMEATPPPDVLAYNLGGTNHTFFARNDICGECHGFEDASGVQPAFDATSDALQTLQEDAILLLITDLIAAGNVIDLNGAAVIDDAADIQAIEFGEFRGRQAITVTFTDTTVVGPTRMPDIDVVDAFNVVQGELYDFAHPTIPKAGWNYLLAHNDGSRGVHNPDFVFAAMNSAIDALLALP
jgi:hypothetical protein